MQTTAMPRRSPNILGPNRDDDGSCAAACEQTVQFGVVRRGSALDGYVPQPLRRRVSDGSILWGCITRDSMTLVEYDSQ
jgi:hypothetical protein